MLLKLRCCLRFVLRSGSEDPCAFLVRLLFDIEEQGAAAGGAAPTMLPGPSNQPPLQQTPAAGSNSSYSYQPVPASAPAWGQQQLQPPSSSLFDAPLAGQLQDVRLGHATNTMMHSSAAASAHHHQAMNNSSATSSNSFRAGMVAGQMMGPSGNVLGSYGLGMPHTMGTPQAGMGMVGTSHAGVGVMGVPQTGVGVLGVLYAGVGFAGMPQAGMRMVG
jgi:hypothetical protein